MNDFYRELDKPNAYEKKLLEAGRRWAYKALNIEGGRGFFITEGIRQGITEHEFTPAEPKARALAGVGVVTELQRQIDATRSVFVNEARKTGASWTEVGKALGISKQAAQQKFGANAPEHVPARFVDVPMIGEIK